MEEKFVINAAGEKLLLGNDVIELKDFSMLRYDSTNPEDLATFFRNERKGEYVVMVKGKTIVVYDRESRADRYLQAKAMCLFQAHSVLSFVMGFVGKDYDLPVFIQLLTRLKNYAAGDKELLSLLDITKDLKIKKIVSVNYENDKKGNFNYNFKSEKGGNEDHQFPDKVTISIPLIAGMPKMVQKLDLEFFFDWAIDGDGVKMKFKFDNLDLNDIVEEKIKDILTETFQNKLERKTYEKEATCGCFFNLYFGDFTKILQNDEWKYKINSVPVNDYKIPEPRGMR